MGFMNLSGKQWLQIGLDIAAMFVPGVKAIEDLALSLGDIHGKDKQDAVVNIIDNSTLVANYIAEKLTGKDLIKTPEVDAAMRDVIDALVHFQNAVIKAHADAAK